MRVLHHDVDEDGYEEAQDRGAVTHLIPVDGAVPGRTAVHELVAQDVEPVEDEAERAGGILRGKGPGEGTGRRPEPLLPVLVALDPVVMLPEGVEDVPVLHEQGHPVKWGRCKRFANNRAQGEKARRAAGRFRPPEPRARLKLPATKPEREAAAQPRR